MLPRPHHRQAGQASLEYTGVLAVLAVVLTVAVATAAGGAGVLNGVVRGVERAICRVTGDDCLAAELEACTVRSGETAGRLGLKLAFVELGGGLALLREELSDGTVDVTLVEGYDGATSAGIGASAGVRVGGERIGGGAMAQAQLLVRLGRRTVWHRPDDATADRLVRDLREELALGAVERVIPVVGRDVRRLAGLVGLDGGKVPRADVVGFGAGAEGLVQAELPRAVELHAGLAASVGGTRDRRTGRRTLVLALDAASGLTLARAVGGGGVARGVAPTVVLTFDRDGTPLELAVALAATGQAPVAGLPPGAAAGKPGDRVEVTARLDLRRPGNRTAYDALLTGLTPRGVRGLAGAVAVLGRQLETAARRDVVRHGVDAATYGADAQAALAARLGGSVEVSRTTSTLRDAWTRPAGGTWQRRTDCLGGAVA